MRKPLVTSLFIFLGVSMGISPAVQATEIRDMYRSVKYAGMGGAGVAVVEDENAIFMNPAGLAAVKGLQFNYVTADIEMSADVITTGLSGAAAFGNIDAKVLNMFMGKNLFLHGQIAPSLLMPHFGFAFLSDHQLALSELNKTNPRINLGYQSTNGLQMAFGTSVLSKSKKNNDLRVGLATKIMWRRGGYHDLSFLDILRLSQGPQEYLNELTGDYGRGIGVDLGLQYLHTTGKRLTWSTGLALTDMGDTTFDSPQADTQKSDLTWGVAATYKVSKIKATLAYDLKKLLDSVEYRKRSHLGLELSLPIVSVYGGIYQMALSYGAAVDLWLFKITAASYAEEQMSYATQNPERRYDLRVALKFGI